MDGLDACESSAGYAGGMTVRDIRHHPATTIGTELSIGTISNITDAVADAVMAWQTRPLEEFYPVIYLDAICLKVRADHKVGAGPRISRWAWTPTGFKHARGLWAGADEGASFWAHVCATLPTVESRTC